MFANILATIGGTPLVRLSRVFPDAEFALFGKIEALNPGGSVKDRPALAILEDAWRHNAIDANSVVVESSSGNMGVGLAQACRYYGLRFICVVDAKASDTNVEILTAYGAEVDYVSEPDPVTGEFLQARLNRVQTLLAEIEGSFWPNQYTNLINPRAHYESTMREIIDQLEDRLDYLFAATSTCGTVRGCAEYCRDRGLGTKIIAVDAKGSLIFGHEAGERLIPGIGAGMRPPLCDRSLIDDVVHVSDADCVRGCRMLVEREAILAGGSAGGVIAAVARYRDRLPAGARCAAILCDRGERYLSTIYNDAWVEARIGAFEQAWPAAEPFVPSMPLVEEA